MPDHDSLELYEWFLKLLYEYLRAHPIGKWIGLELGMELEDSVRKPDTAVILNSNPIPFQSGDHAYKGVCDLCIESLSTATSEGIKRDTVTKKEEYEKNGVKEYYILDDRHKKTVFYRLNPQTKKYDPISLEDNDVVCSQVLPGFCFRLRDVQNLTPLRALADDPFYPYVLLEYQQEKHQTKEERKRADQEQKEKEKERKEKEKLRADQERKEKEKEKLRADQEQKEKEKERLRADQERKEKEKEKLRAKQEQQKREKLEADQEKLIRFLKEKGFDPTELL